MRSFVLLLLVTTGLARTDYFQQDVQYTINVTLNDSLHTLTGDLTLQYKNNSPDTLNYLWFHIWPNAYKNTETAYAKQEFEGKNSRFQFAKEKDRGFIDSLDFSISGTPVEYIVHEEWIDVIKLDLPSPLFPGTEITIKTPFFVKIPKVYSRFGHNEKHYEITQWYPKPAVYDSKGWHPMPYLDMGEFYSEFGVFDVFITLPQDYRIMATGDLVNGENEYSWLDSLAKEGDLLHALDKKEFKKALKTLKKLNKERRKHPKRKVKTLHFHQKNVHDFAWFADRDYIVRKGALQIGDPERSVTLWSFYLPKNAELWENSIEYIHDAGYWYSEFVGEYPYNHITAVDGDLSAGGGMEYPNITVISSGGSKDILEFVIMHEVGHNWFYGILGSNERMYTWIDEGFNEWINQKYIEKKFSPRPGAKFVISETIQNKLGVAKNLNYKWISHAIYSSRAIMGDEQPLSLAAYEFESSNYGALNYMKTGTFSYYLEKYVGDSISSEILHKYYDNWSFKHPLPSDFETIARSSTEKDLDWYFKDMVQGRSYIDYEASDKGGIFTITNNGSLPGPLQVSFYDKENNELSKEWLEGFTESKTIDAPDDAVKMIIDPDQIIPDVLRYNNSSKKDIKFRLLFDIPDYTSHEIFIAPWLMSYNAYNGLAPGLMVYTGYIPGFDYGLMVLPQWDFVNNKAVGKVSGKKTLYNSGPFRRMIVTGSASKFEGRNGLAFDFSGLIRKPIYNYPSITASGNLYFHSLDSLALNPGIYDHGEYMTGKAGIIFENYPSYHLRYHTALNATVGFSGGEFLKVSGETWLRYRFNREFETKARFWVGSFLSSNDIPKQYSIFMNGGVDPDFEEIVFDRTDNGGKGYANLGDEQYILDGPGLRGGASILPSKEMAWGINLDQKIYERYAFYIDAVGATDLEEKYITAGLAMSLGPISVYVPFYQGWESNSTPDSFGWIKDRVQFQIAIANNLGQIF